MQQQRRRAPRNWLHFTDEIDRNIDTHVALTPHEALQCAPPHHDPAPSILEALAAVERIVDAIDALPPREQWVFLAVAIERRPMRAIAKDLSISVGLVHKISVEARRMVQDSLADLAEAG